MLVVLGIEVFLLYIVMPIYIGIALINYIDNYQFIQLI